MDNGKMMAAAENGIILHVGWPKTGTTTLQETLFSGHSQVHYLGKMINNGVPKGCRSMVVYDVLEKILWQLGQQLEVEKTRKLFKEQILPELSAGRILAGSWEGIGISPPGVFAERLKRLQAIFGSCRVMITLRNPLTWAPSEFLQQIKGHFIQQKCPWMGSALFMEIEDWFERRVEKAGGVQNFLSYSLNIQSAISMMGEDNVGVFLFEELKENPDRYYRKICQFMGIDADEGLALSHQKHLHKRISQQQLDFLKALDASWWRRMLVRRKSRQKRTRLWKQALPIDEGNIIPAQVSLPLRLERETIAATREGNRWLVENLSLPLDKYNYPL